MSATGRGSVREDHDHYATPQSTILEFLDAWDEVRTGRPWKRMRILDPCAGGIVGVSSMPYPEALKTRGYEYLKTVDIRFNSPAEYNTDFLRLNLGLTISGFDLVISNPPYNQVQEFVEHALNYFAEDDGHVVFLTRLNLLGSQKRKEFWKKYMPQYVFVHSKRPSFVKGGTDATEYCHMVWTKGYNPKFALIRVI